MLLAKVGCCRVGDRCGDGRGVGRPYFIVGRGRRRGVLSFFGCEAISAHDIDVLGVFDALLKLPEAKLMILLKLPEAEELMQSYRC